jgi:hypothetical protein
VNSDERGFSESASLRPSSGLLFPLEAFVVFSQEKAKPAVKQGRKITGLIGDSRIALKRLARLFL